MPETSSSRRSPMTSPRSKRATSSPSFQKTPTASARSSPTRYARSKREEERPCTAHTASQTASTIPLPCLPAMCGECKFRIVGLGNFIAFIRTPAGYVVLILLPFVLLIALNVGKLVKSIGQYRSGKRAEREAAAAEQKRENERLAEQARADREEVERLKEELRRLKERPDREGGPNDSEQ